MAKTSTKPMGPVGVTKSMGTAASKSPSAASFRHSSRRPTEEQIRSRAYEIFLRRNGGPGDAHSDWLQAERELHTASTR